MTNAATDLQMSPVSLGPARSIAPTHYVDDGIAKAEVDVFFRRGWIGVGRSDRLAEPGSYEVLDVAGQNIILLRDRENHLRAFANSCRHRAARLLDGTGTCRGIRCPFHSWFYGLDGRLVSAPHMDDVDGFDRDDFGLVRYRAEERFGFIFLSLSEPDVTIDDHLTGFAGSHGPWPLEGLVSLRRRHLVVDCNWKAFLEVFNEYYHLPFVHPDSIDSIYASPDAADRVDGGFATQFGPTEGTGALLESAQHNALPTMPGLSGRWAHGARYTWIFPNMAFAAGSDALWVYEAYPLGAARCDVFQTACFPRATVEHPDFAEKSAAYLDRLDAALDEDVPALVNQQRGLTAPDARQGPFQPLLESNVARFAGWYADRWAAKATSHRIQTSG